MGWFKDWREKMKKTFVFKASKVTGRTVGKGVQYGSPYIGAFFGGPLGAFAGMWVGAAAGQIGPNKNRGSQLKRDLIHGGAVTVGTTAVTLATGGSLTTSLFKSAESIFGGSPAAAPAASAGLSPGEAAAADLMSAGGGAASGGNPLTTAASIVQAGAATVAKSGGPNTAQLNEQYMEQLKLAEQLRLAGDEAGYLQAMATAEGLRQALLAAGETPGGMGGGFLGIPWPLVIVGGAVLFMMSRGRKQDR